MLDALARFIHRRRRRVLLGALAFIVVAGVFGAPVVGLLESEDDFDDPASESFLAREDIARATGAGASPDRVVLVRHGAPADSAAGREKTARVVGELRADRDVATVAAYEGRGASRLVSRDGRSTYAVATFQNDADETAAAERLQERVEREPGVTAGGPELAGEQVGDQVSEDLGRAEMMAFPILFALSLFVFRGVIAALLPLAVGMSTILTTFLALRGVNEIEGMSIFATNLIIGMGLGLSIDYSLFVISRFREEMEKGLDTAAALRATLRTAGRTVIFSAVTVAAATASLTVFPQRFLYSMGIGGTICALAAMLVSLTLLPALLAALGPRVNALSLKRWQVALHREASQERGGFWYRLSQAVMRRPAPIAAGAAVLLIVVGLPFTRIDFTGVDASVLPPERSARVVDDALRTEFPPDESSPVIVAARAPAGARAEVEAYVARLGRLEGVASPPRVQQADGLWRIDLVPRGRSLSEEAKGLVADVRVIDAPFPVRVGGSTAAFIDQRDSLGDHLPVAVAILVTTTLVILFLMTASLILPIKAVLMNVLTVSAAFGLLVLIFQDGRLEGLLAYESQGALELTQPILLFAIAFGLSTDYGVFLLTRIKEARDAGHDDREAVALGLERTGRIVTCAALLFVVAIGAFSTSEIVFIKELGVGTALAVIIDATIVRALLVPSLMRLLGHWNWWAPAPLARLHRRIGIGEATA